MTKTVALLHIQFDHYLLALQYFNKIGAIASYLVVSISAISTTRCYRVLDISTRGDYRRLDTEISEFWSSKPSNMVDWY